MNEGYQLVDLLDAERLQQLQDSFAVAFGMGFITVDYRGCPVIEYSGFTDFCHKIREVNARRNLCYQCDAHGGLQAAIAGQPYVYRCHSGLVDFAVPLTVQGKYLGSVMGGQVEIVGSAPELEPILPQSSYWKDDPELVAASKRVYKTTYKKLIASVHLLQDMMQSMLEEEYHKAMAAELEQKNRELREEKNVRINLEEQIENYGASGMQRYLGSESMFYVLNVIARLACFEQAAQTEHAVCDFAGMIRYLTENSNNNFVTIGEELEYIEYYLRIQKYRFEGRLIYEIKVPDGYRGVLCPFMLLQPLVENSIRYGVEPKGEGGRLIVSGRAEGDHFLLAIGDDGRGMSRQQIDALLEPEMHRSGRSNKILVSLNHRLKELFGDACGITIRGGEDDSAGTELQVRLPMTSSGGVK